MSIFCCPKCKGALEKQNTVYRCENGHCYDRSGTGYVNLLPARGGIHGDDIGMLRARREFLQAGFYSPLKKAITDAVSMLSLPENATVLDAGCGEGYYTEGLCQVLSSAEIYGVDVAKDAVKMCDKRHMRADFAAASVYDLPIHSQSCDLVISVFSPFAKEEFHRVLKGGGYLISVIPDARHLWGLKRVLYDTPYENVVAPYEVEGFSFVAKTCVSFDIYLKNQGEIQSLYRMTPYYYRTARNGNLDLEKWEDLHTEAAFQILVYQPK